MSTACLGHSFNTSPNIIGKGRVTTLKSEDMQNQSTLVFSVRSTLGKIKTTPQIGEALEKLCEKRNIKSKRKHKKRLRDKSYAHRGRSTSWKVRRFYRLL